MAVSVEYMRLTEECIINCENRGHRMVIFEFDRREVEMTNYLANCIGTKSRMSNSHVFRDNLAR